MIKHFFCALVVFAPSIGVTLSPPAAAQSIVISPGGVRYSGYGQGSYNGYGGGYGRSIGYGGRTYNGYGQGYGGYGRGYNGYFPGSQGYSRNVYGPDNAARLPAGDGYGYSRSTYYNGYGGSGYYGGRSYAPVYSPYGFGMNDSYGW